METKTLIFPAAFCLYGKKTVNGETFIYTPLSKKAYDGEKKLFVYDEDKDITTEYFGDNLTYLVKRAKKQITVTFTGDFQTKEYPSYPNADFSGNDFYFKINCDDSFTKAVSAFYWKNLLPQIAETSRICKKKTWQKGYVISTLDTSVYPGTYPAVDHEFHIKGRLAIGGDFDKEIVKRMMELTALTMEKDPSGKYRVPCSVQPSGKREYYITRYSLDKSVKAIMFPITGLIELIDSLYKYYCAEKDINTVKKLLPTIEKGMGYFYGFLTEKSSLKANVYYEDQVMKDAFTAQAQAFSSHAMGALSFLEKLVGSNNKSLFFKKLGDELKDSYVKDVPEGYWNGDRYIDYINEDGSVHDHIHLLSNALSVIFGFNNPERDEKIAALIKENDEEFQRFPTFLAGRIQDYTPSEIGSGGPYDLAAAGRYWDWDARYRAFTGDGELILKQLYSVKEAAEKENWYMGERYDLNHVYYNTGKDAQKVWHGAGKYYEYPCVFADVLITLLFGVDYSQSADLNVRPMLKNLEFSMQSKGISYSVSKNEFTIKNISNKNLTLDLNLTLVGGDKTSLELPAGQTFKTDLS